MSTTPGSKPRGPGAGHATAAPSPTPARSAVNPPTTLLILAFAVLVVNLGLLALRSPAWSVAGLVITIAVLLLVSGYRLALSKRESDPQYIPQPWQAKAAAAILTANFLVSIGHAVVIGLEVGKRWS